MGYAGDKLSNEIVGQAMSVEHAKDCINKDSGVRAVPRSNIEKAVQYHDANINPAYLTVAEHEILKNTRLAILDEREKTHGDFRETAILAQQLKQVISGSKAYLHDRASLQHKEALDLIATKIARILTGDPYEPEHWLDIAGYANLGKESKRRD